jgi:hypothetical protein
MIYEVHLRTVPAMAGNKRVDAWRASVLLPSGDNYHSQQATPQEALIELGLFWRGREQTAPEPATSGENISKIPEAESETK